MKQLFTLLFFLTYSVIFSQSTLRGTVKDNKNEALIGATIKVAKQGVVTDENGNYSIALATGKHDVECTYIGYETLKRTILIEKNKVQTIDFQLKEIQTMLNTVTVTSGRFEKPLGEVTVSMEVLKPAFISSTNTQSVDQILDKTPGLTIIGGQPNIRGGSGFTYGAGSRVLVLVDDVPALQADAGQANWNDFQVETIEQIEVLKGASSALYGSSALNGVVNIRTAYAGLTPITTAAAYYTSYRNPLDTSRIWWKGQAQPFTRGMTASHRQRFGKLDLVLGGAWQATRSFNERTSDTLGRLTIGTRYRLNERLTIGFNSNINFGKSNTFFYWKNGKEGAYRATGGTVSSTVKTRYTIDPFVSYRAANGVQHKFLGRFFSVDNAATNGNQNSSTLAYGEYQAQKKYDNGLVATTGLVMSSTFVRAELYGDTTYRSRNIAPYVQMDKKYKKFNFSGGFRYEWNRVKTPEIITLAAQLSRKDTIPGGLIKESKPVFRLGTSYQAADFTFIRASFGQGYRFPTIAEKFVTTNFQAALLIPNVKLTSETGWSSEIGIKQGFKIDNWGGFFDIAAFWSEYQNMIEFVNKDIFFLRAENVGDTRIRGIDMSVAGIGKINNVSISLLTGYTYVDPRFKNFGVRELKDLSVDYNILKYRNRHTFKFDQEATFKNVSLGFSANYLSHIEAIDRIFDNIIPGLKAYRAENNKGVAILDLRLGYSFLKHYRLTFLAKNLANKSYTIRPAIMEAPRNLSVRLDAKF